MLKKVLSDPSALVSAAVADFAELIAQLRAEKNQITVLLTGGTLGIEFIAELGKAGLDLSNVRFIFGDERFVALEHSDRNEHQAIEVWPGITDLNLLRYPDAVGSLSEARTDFNGRIEQILGQVEKPTALIDLTILGMGPDGHIASLFPDINHEDTWIVAESNSPKPPQERLSFSYRALNNSERVWFLVSGAQKASSLARVFDGELPAAKVSGRVETRWYLDQEISDEL